MNFLAAPFLLGLVVLAVPLVIHLIHRQRYPERRFTTLRFFVRTVKNNSVQRRLIDRLLLALRMLALAALIVALAQPSWNVAFGEQRQAVVIVLDNSPSMTRLRDNRSLFDRAKAQASALVAGLGANDRAELIFSAPTSAPLFTTDRAALTRELARRAGEPLALLVDGQARTAALPGATSDAQALADAIAGLPEGTPAALVGTQLQAPRLDHDQARLGALLAQAQPSAAPGDMRAAILLAARTLRESGAQAGRIVVLSDLQRSEWLGEALPGLDGLTVNVIAVDPLETGSEANLALEGVETASREAGLGQRVIGTATVRNHGDQPSAPAVLTIRTGEQKTADEVVLPAIAPGASARVSFPLSVMTRERNLLCTAAIRSATETFTSDDVCHFQIGTRAPVHVLCVSGNSGVPTSDREGFFIANALAPRSPNGQGETIAEVRDCDLADLGKQQLFQYGVVVLAGIPTLGADEREKLRQFVTDGGGLLVFPGAKAALGDYNGWGFLPAQVLERKTGDFTFVAALAGDQAAVRDVDQRVGAGINSLSSSAWFRLEPLAGATALAHLNNGAPALIEHRLGRGAVILAAAGAHSADSDWPLRPAFVILLRALVQHLADPAPTSVRVQERTVGDAAATALPADLAGGTPALFRWTGSGYQALPWARQGDRLVMPPASEPGQYLLTVQPGAAPGLLSQPGLGARIIPISINHSGRESALGGLALAEVAALLPGATLTTERLVDGSATVPADPARGLWRLLAVIGLVVLVGESLIAWRTGSKS